MNYFIIFILLLLSKATESQNITKQQKISLNKTAQTIVKIYDFQHFSLLLIGYDSGDVDIIDLTTKQLKRTVQDHNSSIINIQMIRDMIFISSENIIIQYNEVFQIVSKWFEQISITNFVIRNYANQISMYYSTSNGCIKNINFNIFQPNQPAKKKIHQYYFNNHNIQNIDGIQLNNHYLYLYSQKRIIILSLENHSIVKTRKFDFTIQTIKIDQHNTLNNKAIIVSEFQVIYLAVAGDITTFLPYQTSKDNELIGATYCTNYYIVTIHKEKKFSAYMIQVWEKQSLVRMTSYQFFLEENQDINQNIHISCQEGMLVVLSKKGNISIFYLFFYVQSALSIQSISIIGALILSIIFLVSCFKSRRKNIILHTA